MVADVVFMIVIMWIVAICAFSPLAYFIYIYSSEDAEPFGDTEPHGDSESKVLDLADLMVHKVKILLSKK